MCLASGILCYQLLPGISCLLQDSLRGSVLDSLDPLEYKCRASDIFQLDQIHHCIAFDLLRSRLDNLSDNTDLSTDMCRALNTLCYQFLQGTCLRPCHMIQDNELDILDLQLRKCQALGTLK